MPRINGEIAPPSTTQENYVHEKIVYAAYGKAHDREQQNLMMNDRQSGDQHFPHDDAPLIEWRGCHHQTGVSIIFWPFLKKDK